MHLDPAVAPARKTWLAAAAVVVDAAAARKCVSAELPRRRAVYVCAFGEPDAATLQAAISVGAQDVLVLPDRADELVRGISEVSDTAAPGSSGTTVAVVGGRGGAGASVFAVALAHQVKRSLLVDLDPWGGGIDVLLGAENLPGLRWPDLALQGGRVSWPAIREALPEHRGIAVLSGTRASHEVPAAAVGAVLDAGRRAGVTAICDVPRRMTDGAVTALADADLVVVISACDVRSCAAATAMGPTLSAVNPNVGLVVRGPSPGGLRPADISEVTRLPLLAAMRPEPLIAERIEHGGLRLRPRSPLALAARKVAAVLGANRSVGLAA